MTLIDFVTENPACTILSLIIVLSFLLLAVTNMCNFLLVCWSRHLRRKNIAAQGWPPAHCDADGDAVSDGDYRWDSCYEWMNDFREKSGGFDLDPHTAARLAFDAARELEN